ncbi:MAG: thioesterase family protein [Desulfobacterales bacterium]|jgi:thioesterase-3|nr:thioesterase family protein [Desulfobacterales bacterium]
MVHTIDIKVRGFHVDPSGHVNNARYFEFLDDARWAAFEKTIDLMQLSRDGYPIIPVNININYRHAAVINDVLTIETEINKWTRRTGVFHQIVKLKGTDTVIADADVTFVVFDNRKGKTAVLEGEILEKLKTV